MTALNIFNELLEAWECSTPAYNGFFKMLSTTEWEEEYWADGEFYFVTDEICFTTPVLNPFEPHDWVPTAITADGSFLSF